MGVQRAACRASLPTTARMRGDARRLSPSVTRGCRESAQNRRRGRHPAGVSGVSLPDAGGDLEGGQCPKDRRPHPEARPGRERGSSSPQGPAVSQRTLEEAAWRPLLPLETSPHWACLLGLQSQVSSFGVSEGEADTLSSWDAQGLPCQGPACWVPALPRASGDPAKEWSMGALFRQLHTGISSEGLGLIHDGPGPGATSSQPTASLVFMGWVF